MRWRKVLLIISILCIIVMSIMGCSSQKYNVQKSESVNLSQKAYDMMEYIASTYPNRSMGSDSQDLITSYLETQLAAFGYEVSNQVYTTEKAKDAKNIIAKKSVDTTQDTIVIGANWDNLYLSYDSKPDGTYQSGASIAALLTVAEYLYSKTLSYNLEIVFFAGSSDNWSGAEYYLNKLTSTQKDNIKLFINYGYIVGGDNLYIYAQEKDTKYSNLINEVVAVNELSTISKVPQYKNTLDATISNNQIFSYSHIGMFGNNIIFMNNEIPAINYLSINWKDTSYPIYTEVSGTSNILETSQDTLDYVVSRVSKEKILNQFDAVIKSTIYTIVDNGDTLLTTLDDDGINVFFQSQTAYYIFNVVVKIIAAAIILILVAYAKNLINKNREELVKLRQPQSDMIKIDLSKLRDGQITEEEIEKLIKAEEERLKGTKNNEDNNDKNDDDPFDDDGVFE